MMPTSQSFTVSKIAVEYTMPTGEKERIETSVVERKQAEERYEDSQAAGETAILATLPPVNTNFRASSMLRIRLGNMPANSTAYLRAYCYQKLEIEDMSYCFRLPMAYVPAFMGNASINLVEAAARGEADAEKFASVQEVLAVDSMPVSRGCSGLWDLQI